MVRLLLLLVYVAILVGCGDVCKEYGSPTGMAPSSTRPKPPSYTMSPTYPTQCPTR